MYKFDIPRRDANYSSRISPYNTNISRVSQSLQHRPMMYSPKSIDMRDNYRFNPPPSSDNKMKMLKSRVQNISMHSKQGMMM